MQSRVARSPGCGAGGATAMGLLHAAARGDDDTGVVRKRRTGGAQAGAHKGDDESDSMIFVCVEEARQRQICA
eukprot:1708578-Prymnesium_polylepis.1